MPNMLNAVINAIRLKVQGGTNITNTPDAGYILIFVGSDGKLRFKKSDGTVSAIGSSDVSSLDTLDDVSLSSPDTGSILAYDGTTDRWKDLGVGSNGQVLIADSSEPTGLRWGSAEVGGATDENLQKLVWMGW